MGDVMWAEASGWNLVFLILENIGPNFLSLPDMDNV